MNLTDILIGVVIVGGAYYLYIRNSKLPSYQCGTGGDSTPCPVGDQCGPNQRWNWCVKGCVPKASMMPDCPPPAGIAVGEPNPSKPECNTLLPMLIAIKAGKCPSGYEPSCYGSNGAGCCEVKEHVHCTNNGELIDDCNGKVVGHCDRGLRARLRITLS